MANHPDLSPVDRGGSPPRVFQGQPQRRYLLLGSGLDLSSKPEAALTKRRRNSRNRSMAIWPHFDLHRSEEERGDLGLLVDNPVSVFLPPGSSHFDLLNAMARVASRPIQIKLLHAGLKASSAPRGMGAFGHIGDEIERIMANYPTLRWWMEADGLVVDEPENGLGRISRFDRIAGALVVNH